MKNEMNEMPTPETTFRYEADKYTGGFSAYENMRDHAIDLERRLTIAREALKKLDNWLMRDAQRKRIIEQALTLTAPKP